MQRYIIQTNSNGNALILSLQEDGTYSPFANCHGEKGLAEAITLVAMANR